MLTIRVASIAAFVIFAAWGEAESQEGPGIPSAGHPPAEEQPKGAGEKNETSNNAEEPTQPAAPTLNVIVSGALDVSSAQKQTKSGDQPENGWDEWFAHFFWEANIGDALIALFTGGLFVATWLLFCATRRLVTGAEDTAQHQLRAYVSITLGRIQHLNTDKMFIETIIENHGQTPAAALSLGGVMGILLHPLPPKTGAPPRKNVNMGSVMSLYPGHPKPAPIPADQFTPADRNLLSDRNLGIRVYFFGLVEYRDVFKKPRWTKVCASFQTTTQFLSVQDGNDFNPVWEYASQHNEFE